MDTFPHEVWFQMLIYISKYVDRQVSKSGRHSAHVALWAKSTGRQLEMSESEVQELFWAAMLHDIGKIGIPANILSKDAPLDVEEWKLMKMHPIIGSNIVRSLDNMPNITPAITSHQEKYDGTGYPQGLKGEQIPLSARILAIADAYQAMTEDRAYRKAKTHEEAITELKVMSGKQFDPKVVDVFLNVVHTELAA